MIYFCIWWFECQQGVVSIKPVPEKLTISSGMCLGPASGARNLFLYLGSLCSCPNTAWLIWPARETRELLNYRKWQHLGELLGDNTNDCPVSFKYELSKPCTGCYWETHNYAQPALQSQGGPAWKLFSGEVATYFLSRWDCVGPPWKKISPRPRI